ncbi:MAG: hypothetical protein JSV98_00635 [candidate division WOR-3 bacterium]|nr:MAG: hypothetical protein JSV98_00635 [candidate division WOR-3 bacterium]
MTYILLALTFISTTPDSTVSAFDVPQMSGKYSRQVLISTLVGAACIGGMAVFHLRANDAYSEYQAAESMSAAIETWERVQRYDNIRNAFGVGAALFIARAIYYQVKKSELYRSSHILQMLDLRYAGNSKMAVGIKRNL